LKRQVHIVSEKTEYEWHVICYVYSGMKKEYVSQKGAAVLEVALIAGLFAAFMAIAVPLVRGAQLRQQSAECAGKILRAADAFDLYASAMGYYPPDQKRPDDPCYAMTGFFAYLNIDWWNEETDVGGRWEWDNENRFAKSIAIYRPRASRHQMENLDAMLDDGDLMTGSFQRWGEKYHYILEE